MYLQNASAGSESECAIARKRKKLLSIRVAFVIRRQAIEQLRGTLFLIRMLAAVLKFEL